MGSNVTKQLHDKLNNSIKEYVQVFCHKHDVKFTNWLEDKVGEVANIEGVLIDFKDIRTDLETAQPVDNFINWYDYTAEKHTLGRSSASYESWIIESKEYLLK